MTFLPGQCQKSDITLDHLLRHLSRANNSRLVLSTDSFILGWPLDPDEPLHSYPDTTTLILYLTSSRHYLMAQKCLLPGLYNKYRSESPHMSCLDRSAEVALTCAPCLVGSTSGLLHLTTSLATHHLCLAAGLWEPVT
jgi:hypothetical protein